MNWEEALNNLSDHPGNSRKRWLCSDENPNVEVREAWRAKIIRVATGQPEEYPSLATQFGNLSSAIGKVIVGAIKGERITADKVEQDRRLDICKECPFYDAIQNRCLKCGCNLSLKTLLETSHCPINKW